MIELMTDLPPNLIGLRASGTVTAEDYETQIVPALERALESNEKVRLLYHIGADFRNFEAGAIWEDAKVGLSHLTAWERIAVVSDVEWLRVATKAFGFAMPGEVKVFSNAQLDAAIAWLQS